MTESADNKTKRKYLKMLNQYEWSYQYSIFYEDAQDSHKLLDDMVGFKQRLRRKYPDTAFLVRIQAHRKRWEGASPELQAFLMILSTSKLQGILDDYLDSQFTAPVRMIYQKISEGKLRSIYRSIAKQSPHQLHKIFTAPTSTIKRFSVLNKTKLVERSEKLMETED